MAAEKARPENGPHDAEMIDEVAERVFVNYEPPRKKEEEEEDEPSDEPADLAA